MSRSKRGGKPVGWEYWGKRKGGWCVDRKTSHKMERMQHKQEDRILLEQALHELGSHADLSNDPTFKSLFPTAKVIRWYNHPDYGEIFVIVDGRFYGYAEEFDEILSYSYHNGVDYEDYEDLKSKYREYLDCGNARWSFLP